jgi:3-hydroxy-9,10-secoandrosta-1,3,5(10)-triene-9,17-dione monooxygenase
MTWTHEDAMTWAESMVPALADRAAQAEQLREVPRETMDECEAVDAFALVVPERSGGHGLEFRSLTEIGRILAHGCMSSAWTVTFLMLHNWFIARGPKEFQDAIWSDKTHAMIPAPLAPTGTARPVDGGYLITGRWQWATGVMHADWVMVNCLIDRGDGGPPEGLFCMAPIEDVTVDDVWHTSGMRGTGSNDVVADDLFVPDVLTLAGADLRGDDGVPGAAIHPEPFISYPMTPVLVNVAAAPALGGAEAAVDGFRDIARARVLPYSMGQRQADFAGTQIRLSDARATVRAARLVWRDSIDRLSDTYDSGGQIQREDRGEFRLAAAHVVRLSRSAVNTALEGAGASVYFEDSPLQRIQRDIETIKGHVVYDWDRAAQLAGKLELGAEAAPTDML